MSAWRNCGRVGLALCAVLMPASGCYSYHVTAFDGTRPGQELHVAVSEQGRSALQSSLGPESSSIDGTVFSTSRDTLVLIARAFTRNDGTWQKLNGDRLAVGRGMIDTLLVRRMHRARTLVAGVSAIGLAIIAHAVTAGDGLNGRASTPTAPSK